MALGSFNIFSWKNKEQREREEQEYAQWAFPHGPKQRENLEKLMSELFPKEQMPFLMMGFLTCKELYERYLKQFESSEFTAEYLVNKEKKYKNIIKKNEMPGYVALVMADLEVDEHCAYPNAEEMRRRIDILQALRTNKKR
ncbi:MAG: hypothetical protein FWC66_02545 [Oscillospiraceae bacterium]|nr:hypothetical protein [Oscillospiraceae bacterium]